MTEAEWQASTDLRRMLDQLPTRCGGPEAERCERAWVTACREAADETARSHKALENHLLPVQWMSIEHAGLQECVETWCGNRWEEYVSRATRAALLRCVVNLWHTSLCSHFKGHSAEKCVLCQRICTDTVVEIARVIRDGEVCPRCNGDGEYCRTVPIFSHLPGMPETCHGSGRVPADPSTFGILGDALEDAGCTDEAILNHLRGTERRRCNWCEGTGYHVARAGKPNDDGMAYACPDCDETGTIPVPTVHAGGECWVICLLLGETDR